MKINYNIKRVLELVFGIVGIEAKLSKKDKNKKIIAFDQNQLAQYCYPNKRMELYYEGLDHANVRWTDNFSKQLRFYSLQQIVEYILASGLEGDFAECGCWKGHSSFIIAKLLSKNGYKNFFHIFDSFEGGLSNKTSMDKNENIEQSEEEVSKEKKLFSSLEEDVRNVLIKFNFIKFYKGWIPNRFKEINNKQFAFVHIDVDLFKPTWDSLEFFFPRLVVGGGIVVDDYGMMQFPGCKRAVDEFLKQNKYAFFYEMPAGGCFIIK